MATKKGLVAAFAVVALAAVFFASTAVSALPSGASLRVYADDRLWASIGLQDFQGGPDQSFDKIYVFPGTNLLPVADAGPGNPDYNGGRWEVHAVTFTGISPMQFTNDEALWAEANLGHLSVSGVVKYFECPLLPL